MTQDSVAAKKLSKRVPIAEASSAHIDVFSLTRLRRDTITDGNTKFKYRT